MTPDDIFENSIRLTEAASVGDSNEIARLIPISDPTRMSNSALCLAAQEGYVKCVQLLIPVSSTVVFNEYSSPLLKAAQNGHTECVKLLVDVTEGHWIHQALCAAVEFNHMECVKTLIGSCDPKERNSLPLQLAVQYNNEKCMDLLYDLSDPIAAMEALKFRYSDQPKKWIVLAQRIEAERLHAVLSHEVKEITNVRNHKM